MSARKRKGYNWKARQVAKGRRTAITDLNSLIEDAAEAHDTQGGDTNFVALPSKGASRKEDEADLAAAVKKRTKLNPKQKKRLRKVLEAKEKKAKVLHLHADHLHTIHCTVHSTEHQTHATKECPLLRSLSRTTTRHGGMC